ncbi:MAG TPA: effector-associated domain EAD1-containing protein [Pyrinomonadaceae bacterium]|nr:effector-associated domain EAD1-containing protein [Pyrinomonadaceae bacterium]
MKTFDWKKDFLREAASLYPHGPGEQQIWLRSGGDISAINLNQNGKSAWFSALDLLEKGGGGRDITFEKLIAAMLDDFQQNSVLQSAAEEFKSSSRGFVADENISAASVAEIKYALESQSWFVPGFPETEKVGSADLLKLESENELVIFTVTEVELQYALAKAAPLEGQKAILQGSQQSETYFAAKFGAFNAVLTRCRMGTIGTGAATLAAEQALRLWRPRAAFMPGIAFGKDSQKQHFGQILVASAVVPYEVQRIGAEEVIPRGIPLASDGTLLNRFENSYGWHFELPDGKKCGKEFGPVLSGNSLVDNENEKAALFKTHPACIGGEMEGAGFYSAAHKYGVPCLLLKAICDWGDGKKHGKHQPLAAAVAASFLHHVLTEEDSLESLSSKK